MKIYDIGIVYETDEFDEVKNLVCKCGHALYLHAMPVSFNYPEPKHHTIYPSQCVPCGSVGGEFVCKKFSWKNSVGMYKKLPFDDEGISERMKNE